MEIVKKKRVRKPKGLPVPVIDIVAESFDPNDRYITVGIKRHKDATYSLVKVTMMKDKVLKCEIEEPNLKAVAVDSLKIACMKDVIDAVSL